MQQLFITFIIKDIFNEIRQKFRRSNTYNPENFN